MPFQEIGFMEPLRKFLVQYPALQQGEFLEIDYLSIDQSNQNRPQGEALSFVGSSIVRKTKVVTGRTTLDEQANLLLILRRYSQNNDQRRDTGDFLFNYCRWINWEQSRRDTIGEHPDLPHFSMTQQESIRADGGMQTAAEIGQDSSGIDEYQLQIHLEYQTIY